MKTSGHRKQSIKITRKLLQKTIFRSKETISVWMTLKSNPGIFFFCFLIKGFPKSMSISESVEPKNISSFVGVVFGKENEIFRVTAQSRRELSVALRQLNHCNFRMSDLDENVIH